MSASLVGSEMCIRDSPGAARGARPRWEGCPPRRPGGSASAVPFKRLVPVSYTHLTLPTICSV
eukprot:14311439-Alexandrium_andersonii.AAC.1